MSIEVTITAADIVIILANRDITITEQQAEEWISQNGNGLENRIRDEAFEQVRASLSYHNDFNINGEDEDEEIECDRCTDIIYDKSEMIKDEDDFYYCSQTCYDDRAS